jgi:hypothetical protein
VAPSFSDVFVYQQKKEELRLFLGVIKPEMDFAGSE